MWSIEGTPIPPPSATTWWPRFSSSWRTAASTLSLIDPAHRKSPAGSGWDRKVEGVDVQREIDVVQRFYRFGGVAGFWFVEKGKLASMLTPDLENWVEVRGDFSIR